MPYGHHTGTNLGTHGQDLNSQLRGVTLNYDEPWLHGSDYTKGLACTHGTISQMVSDSCFIRTWLRCWQSSRAFFFWARTRWYLPQASAALSRSAGSAWSLVSASASISSEGHHRTCMFVLSMLCLITARSIATRLSSAFDGEDGECSASYNDLQSVMPIMGTLRR